MTINRRSFIGSLTFGIASIAAGAMRFAPEPIRKSKLFGSLNDSVSQWSGRIMPRRHYSYTTSPLMQLQEKLENSGLDIKAEYTWFERSPRA